MSKRKSRTEGAPEGSPPGERVQKLLSRAGVASRRDAEELIRDGRVSLNGRVVRLGERMRAGDELRVDGERVRVRREAVVLLLNKPTGCLCAERDPEGRPLAHHLVPDDLALHLVGRLDFNTEGVLLLTNDGDLGHRLSHPRHGVLREYDARVRGIPGDETLARLVRGVSLEDGPARVQSARVVKKTDRNAWVRLTLTEGRNREVRRLLERVGHPVMRLRRIRFAGLDAAGLAPGRWRRLDTEEVQALRERGHVGAFELPPDPRPPRPKNRNRAGRVHGQRARAAGRKRDKPGPSGGRERRGDRGRRR